jgi:glycosyltransferase involved in cell wall biosynthesis
MLKNNFGINAFVFKSGYEILSGKYNGNKNFILWVARLDNWKQPEIFIELSTYFPNEKFIMISPQASDIKYTKRIRGLASECRNIEFISQVPFHEINEYFAKAKIFINTSKNEGFPNTFIQSAMNATPIISLNVNPDNFLEKYGCGFCSNGSFDDMLDKMKEILNNNSEWNKLSENAYNYAKENHDVSKITNDLLKVIKAKQ